MRRYVRYSQMETTEVPAWMWEQLHKLQYEYTQALEASVKVRSMIREEIMVPSLMPHGIDEWDQYSEELEKQIDRMQKEILTITNAKSN